MTKQYDVITVGSGVLDAFIETGIDEKNGMFCFPAGTKVQIKDLSFATGGGGINSGICLSKLGLKVGFLGKLGKGHNSQIILRELKKNKIDFLGIQGNERTGYSAILESNNKNRVVLTYKGANDNLKQSEINLHKLKTEWFYFTSMRGASFITQIKIAEFAHKKGIKVAFNPSSYQTKLGVKHIIPLIKNINVLTLNKEEARMLVKKGDIYKGLKALGPKIIIVTDGSRGGCVYDGQFIYKYRPDKVKVADPTGAGDAFGSSFIAGLIKLGNIEKAINVAMANAESLIQKKGAHNGLLSWKEIEENIKKREHRLIIEKY